MSERLIGLRVKCEKYADIRRAVPHLLKAPHEVVRCADCSAKLVAAEITARLIEEGARPYCPACQAKHEAATGRPVEVTTPEQERVVRELMALHEQHLRRN